MLYCEGRHKPKFRGVLHASAALPLPAIGFTVLLTKCNSTLSVLCAFLTSICMFLCLATSGMYHCNNWKKETELFIKDLDHACILFVALGSYLPLSFFALPTNIGFYFAMYVISTVFCGFAWIMNGGNALIAHLISGSAILFVLKYFYNKWLAFHIFMVVVIYTIGLIIFKSQKPILFPDTFGYHELFHVIVIVSMIYTYYIHYHFY